MTNHDLDAVATFIPVCFLDDEEASDLVDALFNVEGVVAHGITDESARAALDELIQWHTPGGEVYAPSELQVCGPADRVVVLDDRWLIHAHLGLGYIGLAEVLTWKS